MARIDLTVASKDRRRNDVNWNGRSEKFQIFR